MVQNRPLDLIADPKTGAAHYNLVVAVGRDEVSRLGDPNLDVGAGRGGGAQGSRTVMAYMFQPFVESFRYGLKEH